LIGKISTAFQQRLKSTVSTALQPRPELSDAGGHDTIDIQNKDFAITSLSSLRAILDKYSSPKVNLENSGNI
jgi:hypothetical protein